MRGSAAAKAQRHASSPNSFLMAHHSLLKTHAAANQLTQPAINAPTYDWLSVVSSRSPDLRAVIQSEC